MRLECPCGAYKNEFTPICERPLCSWRVLDGLDNLLKYAKGEKINKRHIIRAIAVERSKYPTVTAVQSSTEGSKP